MTTQASVWWGLGILALLFLFLVWDGWIRDWLKERRHRVRMAKSNWQIDGGIKARMYTRRKTTQN